MADIYDRLAATALRLLTKYGGKIPFKRVVAEVRDKVTGEIVTPGTTTICHLMGVTVPVDSDLIDGTRIKKGDRILIIPAKDINDADFSPLKSDTVDGWSIEEISEKKPAATALVYFCRIRK